MCGLAGVVSDQPQTELVVKMLQHLRHRGPDDEGVATSRRATFGHRRLAVIDVSSAGHQPMDHQGRLLTFNGELYNAPVLRHELQQEGCRHSFQGHCDSEVLLAALNFWGVALTLNRAVGMFAFAYWDGRRCFLARDRIGQKPLYYGQLGRDFLFSSELTAFRAHPDFSSRVDRQALGLFLRYGYVPAPLSIFTGISKLPPGHYWNGKALVEYWSHPVGQVRPRSEGQALQDLRIELERAVSQRLVSDVPLGLLLSGGVDSSLVAALAQRQSSRPLRTYTMGFEEAAFDESNQARGVADFLGTDHCEVRLSAHQARELIPCLPNYFDEPFCDPSQLPTLLICQAARQEVTVALSGDDGDSLFFGYDRYPLCANQWSFLALWPVDLRRRLGRLLEGVPPTWWARLSPYLANRVHGLQELLGATRLRDNYDRLAGFWNRPEQILIDPFLPSPAFESRMVIEASDLESLMFYDVTTLLPDGILTKVDRASMAWGLEVRSPLLDHRVVELAWSLPLAQKYRAGQFKWILRQLLYQLVPEKLVNRPKQGFCVPLGDWLRGPFQDWAGHLLSRLDGQGFFRPEVAQRKWREFLDYGCGWEDQLWSLLIFTQWWERWSERV